MRSRVPFFIVLHLSGERLRLFMSFECLTTVWHMIILTWPTSARFVILVVLTFCLDVIAVNWHFAGVTRETTCNC